MSAGVWLITGAQASGKSTVADLLARRHEHGVHVPGGQFYRWAVNGWVHFDDQDQTSEARRCLDLRYRLAAVVADEYASAGFTCVVQDNIYGGHVQEWMGAIRARPRRLVVLRPTVEVVEARDQARRERTGKVAYRGAYTPAQNDADLMATPQDLGLWLDTSAQTPDQTVAEILQREAEAVIA
jgi:adenylylsulfate kinase-like enzyme